MPKTVVLTGVGRDRVGIVAELARLLFESGCNLLDSSMTLLRGEFAIIVMLEIPSELSIAQLEQKLREVETQLGMNIHVRELSASELQETDVGENQFIVSVYGADKPGIVAKVTRALAERSINITDVQTKSTGGTSKLFVMILEVSAPASLRGEAFELEMRELGTQVGVDISVQALEVLEL